MSQFYFIFLILGTFASSIQHVTSASNSDLKFDFTGYTNVAKLMVNNSPITAYYFHLNKY